jgi:hypothetical protein
MDLFVWCRLGKEYTRNAHLVYRLELLFQAPECLTSAGRFCWIFRRI